MCCLLLHNHGPLESWPFRVRILLEAGLMSSVGLATRICFHWALPPQRDSGSEVAEGGHSSHGSVGKTGAQGSSGGRCGGRNSRWSPAVHRARAHSAGSSCGKGASRGQAGWLGRRGTEEVSLLRLGQHWARSSSSLSPPCHSLTLSPGLSANPRLLASVSGGH